MNQTEKPIDKLIYDLRERAKELACLYEIQELLTTPDITIDEICKGVIKAIPPGWQYPDICLAEITMAGNTCRSPGFQRFPWAQSADIHIQDEKIGQINVVYTEERPDADEGPFLKEERKLIDTIAEQLGFYLLHQQLRQVFQEQMKTEEERKSEWSVILDLLKRTDPNLLMRISRKMITYMSWNDIPEVENLLQLLSPAFQEGEEAFDPNQPFQRRPSQDILAVSDEVFTIAGKHMPHEDILENIQKWIKEDRSSFLMDTLVDPSSSLSEIGSAIERYSLIAQHGIELTPPREKWFRIALIRRILSDQPKFVEVAQNYINIEDFPEFTKRVLHTADSHGMLGGKSSGLFLAAQIIKNLAESKDILQNVRTPRTWYLSSDSIFNFMASNNLEDIIEQKYKDVSQVRQEYPYIVHVFKNSPLPPEIVKGLSLALDDLGDVPLIVRSSSHLEDRTNVAFAGKYKSLFIANQGTKEERLIALVDAITEVFASMFAPDPIEYRHEHHLLDYHEEMGIMIQEVVGTRVGHFYFPAFAGAAFSHNEFPWSKRISREDSLVRVVPGLGTRAVDRISDDYPVLVSPGKPNLRVNISPDEIIHYSPQKLDVINLKTRKFETIELQSLLKEFGQEYPQVHQIVSIVKPDHIRNASPLGLDFEGDDLVVTFERLFTRSNFLERVKTILDVLQEVFNYPVDIEFAHDGSQFYLLQCRAQSYSQEVLPAIIPDDISPDRIVFSADRYISNGRISNITHIVYVDPQEYSELDDYQRFVSVGKAVSMLNQILPKHRFILMGPGRWGSRGDIKLGVNVTYSDISNTAMLIEIARVQKDYLPEPSFGTHFFLDLVEASIRYLPLFPDNPNIKFNDQFLLGSKNILPDLLPDCRHLANVIHVIDVPASTGGKMVEVYMNADLESAVAVLR